MIQEGGFEPQGDLLTVGYTGIRVCATDQGRYFTSKIQNRPRIFEVFSRTKSFFDNLVLNVKMSVAFLKNDRSDPKSF